MLSLQSAKGLQDSLPLILGEMLIEEEHGEHQADWERCKNDLVHFVRDYVKIYDAHKKEDWLPFDLWPAQERVLEDVRLSKLIVILKARQLGLSWLMLAYALWLMVFHPAATVLLFSRRDDEAVELLYFRLTGMYDRLPDWMRTGTRSRSTHELRLNNGSRALAFPTTGGRSYTASLAIIDEADIIEDLNGLLTDVKPTVDAGGQLALLSTVNKKTPLSAFKRIYEAARRGENDYKPVFLSWRARPERTQEWYEAQKRDVLARTGAKDELWQEYPDTPEEALAAKTLDKRIPPEWLMQCYEELRPLVQVGGNDGALFDVPSLPGLRVFRPPMPGRSYGIGGDPAEGNPTSDNSALEVIDADTGEQVASLAEHLQPSQFGATLNALSKWYNRANVLVERNNHGHAVLLWLHDNAPEVVLENGYDGKRGWLNNSKGKALLYDACADAFKDQACLVHNSATYEELASIDGSTLLAPPGQHDDRADAFALAVIASRNTGKSMLDWLKERYGKKDADNKAGSDPELD